MWLFQIGLTLFSSVSRWSRYAFLEIRTTQNSAKVGHSKMFRGGKRRDARESSNRRAKTGTDHRTDARYPRRKKQRPGIVWILQSLSLNANRARAPANGIPFPPSRTSVDLVGGLPATASRSAGLGMLGRRFSAAEAITGQLKRPGHARVSPARTRDWCKRQVYPPARNSISHVRPPPVFPRHP